MSLFIEQVQRCAQSFDDQKFPLDAYFSLLDDVAQSDTPDKLAVALGKLLAWKDGKVRRNFFPQGANDSKFLFGNVRPNTCSEHHIAVMKTTEFFEWAQGVRQQKHFDERCLLALGPNKFNLWKSVVIPGFVLHTLQPRCFAIVDRWVLLAQALMDPVFRVSPKGLDLEAYASYHAFWQKTLQEAGIDSNTASLIDIKKIDAGLWVFGKTMSDRITGLAALEDTEPEGDTRAPASVELVQKTVVNVAGSGVVSTESTEFKQQAINFHVVHKMNQAAAIEAAARHFNIDLSDKPSYKKYPGSHFDRWRKQGHVG